MRGACHVSSLVVLGGQLRQPGSGTPLVDAHVLEQLYNDQQCEHQLDTESLAEWQGLQ